MKLMIIDDDITTINVIKSSFDWERLGIARILEAYNGEQAKEVIWQHRPDIVICDIEMPVCSGLEVLRWVREKKLNLEFIFLTCFEKFEYAREGLENHAFAYIVKPFQMEKLEETIRRVILSVEKRKAFGQIGEDEGDGDQRNIVELAKRYILQNFRKDISRNDIAQSIFVSPNYLSRLFVKETGMSIREYTNKCRIEAAKVLIMNTNKSISRISDEVGFESASYFSTVFCKYEGQSPAYWREKYAQK